MASKKAKPATTSKKQGKGGKTKTAKAAERGGGSDSGRKLSTPKRK